MNRVLLSLSLITFLVLLEFPFVHFSANRFVSGEAKTLLSLTPMSDLFLAGVLALMVLAMVWQHLTPSHAWFTALSLSGALVFFLCMLLGHTSQTLMATATPASRVAVGSAFWISFLFLGLILLDIWQRAPGFHGLCILVLLLVGTGLAMGFSQHNFDALSLVKEYHNQRNRFVEAMIQHLELVFMAFVPTLLLGLSLGGMVWRFPRANSTFFGVLNFLQTIPSIALFALLMVPLSWLARQYPGLNAMGVSGIGTAPSVIALVLYTLLPLARNTCTGLANVPADIREAARAMGMTNGQIFYQIMIPLSLPMILSGVRIVIVQLIGLTVVAALIGAGGLGIFVWEGLGQYALDLVLLGALPTIVLALLADGCLQGLIWWAKPKFHER